jgi:hypothetical protein
MKMRMLATIVVLLSVCTMITPAAKADAIYSYIGNDLTSPITQTTVPGINFSMTVPTPLSAGSTLSTGDLLDWSLTAFSYPEINLSNAASLGLSLDLFVSSATGGLPDTWQIFLVDPQSSLLVTIGQLDGLADFVVDLANSDFYLNDAPGTWSAVPESNTFVLIGIGLIPVLLLRVKKSGASHQFSNLFN